MTTSKVPLKISFTSYYKLDLIAKWLSMRHIIVTGQAVGCLLSRTYIFVQVYGKIHNCLQKIIVEVCTINKS